MPRRTAKEIAAATAEIPAYTEESEAIVKNKHVIAALDELSVVVEAITRKHHLTYLESLYIQSALLSADIRDSMCVPRERNDKRKVRPGE